MMSAISSLDMTTVLLTGDSKETATYIGRNLAFPKYMRSSYLEKSEYYRIIKRKTPQGLYGWRWN